MSSGSGRGGAFGGRQVLVLVLTVVALVFVFENRQPTGIRLLVPVILMPLWLALLISLVLGALIGIAIFGRSGGRPRR